VRLLVVTFAALAGLLPVAAPVAAAERPPAVPGAAAAIVVDGRDGDVMFEREADERRQVASTTKLMTALLALERAEPSDVLTAAPYDPLPAESRIDLRRGERMTVADLLEALLLESANDAAETIADGVSGDRARFVAEMNERAAELGLDDTSYGNPIGLDDPRGYSTARDLAAISVELMRHERFARVVDMPVARLESGAQPRVVDNRNRLVRTYPFVTGIKTGHTIQAGYVLVGSAAGGTGGRVISVVLGEPSEASRDADTLALLRWGVGRFRRVRALDPSRPLARVGIAHRDASAVLLPRRAVTVTVRRGQRVERRVRAPEELDGPLPAGKRVGTVSVVVDGRTVRRVGLVTAADVPGAGPLRVAFSALGLPLTLLLCVGILLAAGLAALRLRLRLRLVR
jgi:serine-type D-Ala-D-Ala carboxypeptidase (penicillin-binding protein 5/6)